ncbi:MAG: TIGR00725 family protein [Dehalococcoidia bacterium]|nr:TIGR00725 family protein [Dehalococcoidia bacterium]
MATVVAVIGGATCSSREQTLAEEVGALLAEAGATVVCGGLDGVMAAVCRGAHSRGGFTVGILPGNDRDSANEWVSLPIATGVGQARNMAVVRSSQVVIAIGGAYGTLAEMAFALNSGIPVIGIDTWRLSQNGIGPSPVLEVNNAEEAVNMALQLALERSNR